MKKFIKLLSVVSCFSLICAVATACSFEIPEITEVENVTIENDNQVEGVSADVLEEVVDNQVEEVDAMEVEIDIEPRVNSEDGTVLFTVTTNLPEDTRFIVTVSNEDGYSSQDTATILKNGKGFTAEYDDNGGALKGKYNVEVALSINTQKDSVKEIIGENGEYIKGDYVKGDGTVTANFELEF